MIAKYLGSHRRLAQFHYAHVATKRELVDLALREFVANHKRRDIRLLRGKVKLSKDYNYKLLREEQSK